MKQSRLQVEQIEYDLDRGQANPNWHTSRTYLQKGHMLVITLKAESRFETFRRTFSLQLPNSCRIAKKNLINPST